MSGLQTCKVHIYTVPCNAEEFGMRMDDRPKVYKKKNECIRSICGVTKMN